MVPNHQPESHPFSNRAPRSPWSAASAGHKTPHGPTCGNGGVSAVESAFFSPWNTRNCMVNLGKIMGNLGEIYMFNKSEKDILGIWLWEFITGNGIWKQHKISKIGESKVGATDWLAIWHLPEPRDAIWPYGWSTSASHGMAAYPMENHPSDPFQHDFPVPNHPNHHPIAVISPTFREVRYGKITWEHSEKKNIYQQRLKQHFLAILAPWTPISN